MRHAMILLSALLPLATAAQAQLQAAAAGAYTQPTWQRKAITNLNHESLSMAALSLL